VHTWDMTTTTSALAASQETRLLVSEWQALGYSPAEIRRFLAIRKEADR
jgi:hypothetical protein